MQARHENNKEDLYHSCIDNGLVRVTFQLLTLHHIVMINQRDWEMGVLVLSDGSNPSMSATVSVWQDSGVTNDKFPDAHVTTWNSYFNYAHLSIPKFAV